MKSVEIIKKELEKNYMPVIYKNIKLFRKESGLSLMEVADILEMSHDYLRRIESDNDDIKTCSLKLLIKFSIVFDKQIDDFLKE